MDWIIKRIESCNRKIDMLQDMVKSYENLLGQEKAKKDEEAHRKTEKSLKVSELINLFPELFDRSRLQEINMIKMVVTVMILNLGFGVFETSKLLIVDHSTIINRRRVYYNLLDTKDTVILRAIKIVQDRINGIESDYPFYQEFVKFIKAKYKENKNPRYVEIALFCLLKEKIYFNNRIASFLCRSDAWIRSAENQIKILDCNLYRRIKKDVNLDFEEFSKTYEKYDR